MRNQRAEPVARKWQEHCNGLLDLEVWSEASDSVTVGPGTVTVALPLRNARAERRAESRG